MEKDYLSKYELIDAKNDTDAFLGLIQIRNTKAVWIPEVAGRCCKLIDMILADNGNIPKDAKLYIVEKIKKDLHSLHSERSKSIAKTETYHYKFNIHINWAILYLKKYY